MSKVILEYLNNVLHTKDNKIIYISVSIVLICISPMLFVLFNTLSIGFLLYFRINLRDLLFTAVMLIYWFMSPRFQ